MPTFSGQYTANDGLQPVGRIYWNPDDPAYPGDEADEEDLDAYWATQPVNPCVVITPRSLVDVDPDDWPEGEGTWQAVLDDVGRYRLVMVSADRDFVVEERFDGGRTYTVTASDDAEVDTGFDVGRRLLVIDPSVLWTHGPHPDLLEVTP